MRDDERTGQSLPPAGEGNAKAIARQRRLEVLHQLGRAAHPARGQTTTAPASGAAPSRARARQPLPPRRALWLDPALAALAVVMVAGLVARGLSLRTSASGLPSAASLPQVLTIHLKPDRLACFADVAWSHDGTRVAVAGSESFGSCPGAGAVNIYNATTGKLLTQIRNDGDILHTIDAAFPGTDHTLLISYRHALWSRDDRQLAVPFGITFPDAPNAETAPGFAGLVLLDIGGGAPPRVLLHPTRGFVPNVARWDLSAGSSTLTSPQITGSGYYNHEDLASLPPAYSYTWDAGGALVPAIPLSAQLPQPCGYPVGDPAFGGAVSIWQPGEAALSIFGIVGNSSMEVLPGAYTWQTYFASWSPDGRYLLDDMQLLFRTEPIGKTPPSAAGLGALGLERAPVVPIRDHALQSVYASLSTDTFDPAHQHVTLAWSPDGRYLAALPETFFAGQSTGQVSHPVAVYGCASGAAVRTLAPPPALAQPGFGGPSALRWSPDGSRLLLFDPTTSTLVIWNRDALPN